MGYCEPGQLKTLSTAYATLDCAGSSVSTAGDTLTVNWRVRPEQCFEGGCGWNYAAEYVLDSSSLSNAGLVGWWRLLPSRGLVRDRRLPVPTEVDLEGLNKEIEALRLQLD